MLRAYESISHGFQSPACVLVVASRPNIKKKYTAKRVRSNWWDAQFTVPNYPRYARLETNLGIGQAKEG
ncbi:hypothetical protein TNCV_1981161 [Trichonephila clavipes]|nr:hypothetical protein TNCV_1981161 [Trichonephila clavipes]